MAFANTYFSRFQSFEAFIQERPNAALHIIVVIPCFNEPDILHTLDSLLMCQKPTCNVEVIVVVNHSEIADVAVKEFNLQTYRAIQNYSNLHSTTNFKIHSIYAPDLAKKHAGVGFARKIGMDEAVRRFDAIENPQGIIVAFDADSKVDTNYLVEIERYFLTNKKCSIANIHFEHPLQGDLPQNQYNAIAQYELHLRYYVEALTRIKFPYNFHTVGSSFALRVAAYCRQGGMNKRQAGEDFYFLQKLFQVENVGIITKTKVIPSSRISQRVPFGTGYAMFTLMQSEDNIYVTYTPQSFKVLQKFFEKIPLLHVAQSEEIAILYNSLHMSLQQYILLPEFQARIAEIQNNSSTEQLFVKRFFYWFNGFQVFKYLNFAHQSFFTKTPIQQAVIEFLECENKAVFELLEEFRGMQRGS
jgi:glycosyltransferase involved in cell wall biosynthesis